MVLLVGTNGPVRGQSWNLDDLPILLGRDRSCDIVIDEPYVSREHCRFYSRQGRLFLEDLGSDNSTLVNHVVADKTCLEVGDEIAVGSAEFVLAGRPGVDVSDEGPLNPTEGAAAVTTLRLNDSLYLRHEMNSSDASAGPRTVNDLGLLFSFSRKLSRAVSREELYKITLETLQARFHTAHCWIVDLEEDSDSFQFLASGNASRKSPNVPTSFLRTALDKIEAIHVPGSKRRKGTEGSPHTLIAPICAGDFRVGAILLDLEGKRQIDADGELQLLFAMAYQLAPFFLAVERMEQLTRQNNALKFSGGHSTGFLGESQEAQHLRELVHTLAGVDLSILILGETGTGKEVIARRMHALSARSDSDFITLNCAAIPHNLFESEFFGYEKGAFTDASKVKVGRIELADKGTLFLDEIGDLSLENQAKILRAIELGQFERIGAKETREVDIRVIAATNRDIHPMISRGEFRQDLLHRLQGFMISIPPLRERKLDIPMLAQYFLLNAVPHLNKPVTGFSKDALEFLDHCDWPGNVRELKSCVERAIVFSSDHLIQRVDLVTWDDGKTGQDQNDNQKSLREMEEQHIRTVLAKASGNVSDAARELGISRSTLYKRIADYGIS